MFNRLLYHTMIVGVCILAACNQTGEEDRYFRFINNPENKIFQTIKVGNIQASLKWLPAEYRNLLSKKDNDVVYNDDLYYFNAIIDKTDQAQSNESKAAYLNFDMQQDFVMFSGKDSIAPLICQKVENGKENSYEYIIAFEPLERDKDFMVIYNDKIFGIGTIAFVYAQEDLNRIPQLKKNIVQ